MAQGIVYILINEAMPGYTKIGKTLSTVKQRMKDLDSTGVPATIAVVAVVTAFLARRRIAATISRGWWRRTKGFRAWT